MPRISAKQDSDDAWIVTLVYTVPEPPNVQNITWVQFGFELGSDTEHIDRSLQVKSGVYNTALGGGPAPSVYNMIGLSRQGVKGADRISKAFRFTITSYYTPQLWTSGLIALFYTQKATLNAAPFYGLLAEEVLLESISGEGDLYKLIPVTFNFQAKPNVINQVDTPFPNLTAGGHDLIDYLTDYEVDNDEIIIVPTRRYVHKIYPNSNFALLGVGT